MSYTRTSRWRERRRAKTAKCKSLMRRWGVVAEEMRSSGRQNSGEKTVTLVETSELVKLFCSCEKNQLQSAGFFFFINFFIGEWPRGWSQRAVRVLPEQSRNLSQPHQKRSSQSGSGLFDLNSVFNIRPPSETEAKGVKVKAGGRRDEQMRKKSLKVIPASKEKPSLRSIFPLKRKKS